jgi:hypothetical protein
MFYNDIIVSIDWFVNNNFATNLNMIKIKTPTFLAKLAQDATTISIAAYQT